MNYKKLLEEFIQEKHNKTNDDRCKLGQEFSPGSSSATVCFDLIEEEGYEARYALMREDLQQLRKELCDLLYVTFYTAALYDLPIEEDFLKVHENNMLKFETGHLGENGKWLKHLNHPKVKLPSIQKEIPLSIGNE